MLSTQTALLSLSLSLSELLYKDQFQKYQSGGIDDNLHFLNTKPYLYKQIKLQSVQEVSPLLTNVYDSFEMRSQSLNSSQKGGCCAIVGDGCDTVAPYYSLNCNYLLKIFSRKPETLINRNKMEASEFVVVMAGTDRTNLTIECLKFKRL